MKLDNKFNLKEKVTITELKKDGVVTALYISIDGGMQYNVRYFKDGESKTCYFQDFELEKFKEVEKTIGFTPPTPVKE